jgi:hypothetical protein
VWNGFLISRKVLKSGQMGAIRKGECPVGRNARSFVRKSKPKRVATSVLRSARLPSGLYSLIKVKPGATQRAIRQAIAAQRRLVRQKLRSAKSPQAKAGLTKRGGRLDEAERVLLDAETRSAYDLANKFIRAGTSTPRVREFRARLGRMRTKVLASITIAARRMKAAKSRSVQDHEKTRHVSGLSRSRKVVLRRNPTWRPNSAWAANKKICVAKRTRGERRTDRRKGPFVALEL